MLKKWMLFLKHLGIFILVIVVLTALGIGVVLLSDRLGLGSWPEYIFAGVCFIVVRRQVDVLWSAAKQAFSKKTTDNTEEAIDTEE